MGAMKKPLSAAALALVIAVAAADPVECGTGNDHEVGFTTTKDTRRPSWLKLRSVVSG